MPGVFEQRLKYKVNVVFLPSFSSEICLGVVYAEYKGDVQYDNESEIDYSRDFMLDCTKERGEEILSYLYDIRFFWYERYPKYYKAEWKKRPTSFWSRLRRKFYRAWLRHNRH